MTLKREIVSIEKARKDLGFGPNWVCGMGNCAKEGRAVLLVMKTNGKGKLNVDATGLCKECEDRYRKRYGLAR
jgi:hypothetical protein